MDDLRSRRPLEHGGRDERGDLGAAHALRALVDQEHAIGITVEREPDVGVMLEHSGFQVALVLRVDRVGRMVGERAVQLGEQMDQRDREPRQHGGHHQPAHPVRGVGDDRERPHRARVDERQHVICVRIQEVALLHLSG